MGLVYHQEPGKKEERGNLPQAVLSPKSEPVLRYLMQVASQPWTGLAGFLDALLEIALQETASDTGWVVVDARSVQDVPALSIKSMDGGPVASASDLLRYWRAAKKAEADNAARNDGLKNAPLGVSTAPPRAIDGGSSLSAPLLEGKKVVGLLHVESRRPSRYPEQKRDEIERLAGAAVPALHRVLLKEQMRKAGADVDLIGVSPKFLDLERQIRLVASYDWGPVLITGERGSGKELTAWALHCWSSRHGSAFVPVLPSAFAEGLVADELFGHERHAFTGAAQERLGKFKAADGGTIFFDEVADMPHSVQSGLLRIIERGELPRIGRDVQTKVNVRIVSATNCNLQELIAQGKFRQDLYDRLRVFEIHVPPLRERRDDIPLLIDHFIRKHCKTMQRHIRSENTSLCSTCSEFTCVNCVAAPVYSVLSQLDWPGNVRELKSLVLRLLAHTPDETIEPHHLPAEIHAQRQKPGGANTDLTLDGAIRSHIERVLEAANHNQSEAARLLGTPLSTLRSKMKKLGLKVREA